jgi:lysophospholipase L1-like esterase
LVIGDSVAWGQGLRKDQKMQALLSKRLFIQNGFEASVLSYAHSGATIGFSNGTPAPAVNVPTWWPREIPRSNPTLYEQCLQVGRDHPDRRFDVILLAGGINDVAVNTIFDPATSPATIQQRSHQYCQLDMSSFLGWMRSTYVAANPHVRILVLGYYSIFSEQSQLPSVFDILKALAIETIAPPHVSAENALAFTPNGLSLRDTLIRNSIAFRDASRSDLEGAVYIANSAGSGSNFYFVDPMIADDEAMYTRNALIWGLNGDEKPEDPLYPDRIKYCSDLLGDSPGLDSFTCERASVGHPNINGARRYADRIFASLTTPGA